MIQALLTRPLPSLEHSLGNYLDNIEPLLPEDSFNEATRLCNELLAGEGPQLQQQLEDIFNAPGVGNWNAGFWDSMYLTQRAPLPIHSSPFFAVTDQDMLKGLSIDAVAARIISATSEVISSIRDASLAPDCARGITQDMVQYQRFFGYTREPAPTRDKKLFDLSSNHICILHKNRLFTLKVYAEDSSPIPTPVLRANIAEIMAYPERQAGTCSFIGYLTAHERDSWAISKNEIRSYSANNSRALERIDKALYVLCIDDLEISSLRDRAERLLHNRGENRYFDKYQIVVFRDGVIGSIFEHAPIDAISVGRVWNETLDHLSRQEQTASDGPGADAGIEPVEELDLDLSPGIQQAIATAGETFRELADSTQQDVLLFKQFGTQTLKRLGVSPDACVQLIIQMSYFRAFGNIDNTYESVSTRQFVEGRTDVLRSVTLETVDFIKRCSAYPGEEAIDLLRKAVASIIERRGISAAGSSPDHHLAALYQLALQNQNNLFGYKIPGLFSDASYTLYSKSILSTSNISDPLCLLFGFGPVTPEGLGLAYGTFPGHLVFHLSFFGQDRDRIERFRRELLAALDYLEDLLVIAGVHQRGD